MKKLKTSEGRSVEGFVDEIFRKTSKEKADVDLNVPLIQDQGPAGSGQNQ